MKGPIPLATICELLDISPEEAKKALGRDLKEIDDERFNEWMREAYGDLAKKLDDPDLATNITPLSRSRILEMAQAIKGRHYRHKKGGHYVVLELAKHSETQEDVVVYRSLDYDTVWVRPKDIFEDEGRFEFMDSPKRAVTREQAVQILSRVTDQDNWWEMACEAVFDPGGEDELMYPSIYDVFEALGVPKEEFSRLTGEG